MLSFPSLGLTSQKAMGSNDSSALSVSFKIIFDPSTVSTFFLRCNPSSHIHSAFNALALPIRDRAEIRQGARVEDPNDRDAVD